MDTVTYRNVREITEIERQHLEQRSPGERLGDLITSQAGRIWFAIVHAVWLLVWIWLNTGLSGQAAAFDPPPFSLLGTILGVESIFLSLFILMSQNRGARQAEQRSHLDLQINLLSEYENTKMLKMLQALCEHHQIKVAFDSEIAHLAARTDPREILEQLEKDIPTPEGAGSKPE